MRIIRRKSRLIVKYFLTNLMIYTIPLLVLGILMYKNVVINLKHEVEASNVGKLNQVKEMTDMRMTELGNIAAQISFDNRLTPFMLKNDPLNVIAAKEELGRYKALNAMIEDLFLYYWGERSIYSPAGTFDVETLASSYFRVEKEQEEQFLNELNGLRKPFIKPSQNITINFDTQPMITYWFPIKEISPYGTVLFMIKESRLTTLIENVWSEFHGSVYILNEENRIVASKIKEEPISPQSWGEFMQEHPDEGIYESKLDEQDVSITVARSELTGWTFVMIMPTNQFMSRVIEKESFLFILLMILTITGVGTAVFMAMQQYRPIRSLTDRARLHTPQLTDKPRNEFELIHRSLDVTLHQNKNLKEQIDAQLPLVRERALLKLLKGDASEWIEVMEGGMSDMRQPPAASSEDDRFHAEALNHTVYPNNSELSGATRTHYFVLLMEMTGQEEVLELAGSREEETRSWASFPLPRGTGYGVELTLDSVIAVMVRTEPGFTYSEAGQRDMVRYVREYVRKVGMNATISVGTSYDNIEYVNRSFIEASAAMEFRLKLGKERIIFFDEVQVLQDQNDWYPIEEQIKFVHSLKQGDQTVALEALRVMIDRIEQQQQSILLLKCMCFDIINTLFKAINEMNLQDQLVRIKELVNFETLQQLEEQLYDLVADVCTKVLNEREQQQNQIQDDILTYIHERFAAYDFGLEEVSMKFKLSTSTLSRAIKEQTGFTFSDYVARLRLQEIKHQLVETNLPIKHIITSNGYVDVSTYIRKFKKQEGITPGEYRKMYSTAE